MFMRDADGIRFPTPEYDAFVLIGVGPLNNTRGILVPPEGEDAWLNEAGVTPEDAYYALALRAVYLATRDLNGNGMLDFCYLERNAKGEGNVYPVMPDGKEGPAAPEIFVFQ